MNSWRPILVFIMNYIVGALVAQGLVDPANHNDLVTALTDVVGLLIILVNSLAVIVHLFRHPHGMQNTKPIVPQVENVPMVSQPIFIEDAPLGGGAPPTP